MTMGLVTFFRLVLLEKIALSPKFLSKWLTLLACMLVFSTGVGLVAPKFTPQWPDPVPFVQSFSQQAVEGGPSINKVGYDDDNSNLGGTVRSDSSIVFYNTANTFSLLEGGKARISIQEKDGFLIMVTRLHFQTVRHGLNLNILRPLRKLDK